MRKNQRNRGDGLQLLESIKASSVPVIFFDPQYRAVLDKMAYGNEGARQRARAKLPQMSPLLINDMIAECLRVLRPSGYLMLWEDKYQLCEGLHRIHGDLSTVDLITRETGFGMGYRTRRCCDHLRIFQKHPKTTRSWTDRGIRDFWSRETEIDQLIKYGATEAEAYKPANTHPHAKPEGLQRRLIEAVTKRGQLVVDPCAGGYSVMRAARSCGRQFLGCDLRG